MKLISIVKAAALMGIILSSTDASAIRHTYTWNNLSVFNSPGVTNFKTMNSTSGNFCYLSAVEVDNADVEGEQPRCEVERNAGSNVWILKASVGPKADDTDVRCSAYCFSLN